MFRSKGDLATTEREPHGQDTEVAKGNENNSNYKKDPFKKYISDAFSSSVESQIEAIITIFEKRLDEQVEGVAARKR